MSEIRTGYIAPIEAKNIRMRAAEEMPPKVEQIFITTFADDGTPTRQTLEHALERARWVVENLGELPLNPLTADVIAMSYALLHYAKGRI